jgi:cytochrome P450
VASAGADGGNDLLQRRVYEVLPAPWEAYRLLDEEIVAHRASPDGRQDILALLIAARDQEGRPLTDEELRDQLMTLSLAGLMEMKTVLRAVIERVELRAASQKPERPTRWRSFTTVPNRGTRVILSGKRTTPGGPSISAAEIQGA